MPKITTSPVANSVPFDNSTNGFSATNIQEAIEEAAVPSFNEDILLTDNFFDVLVDNEGNILRGLD